MNYCMDEIIDKVFLGGITGTFNPAHLHEMGITHILTLLDRPIPEELVNSFTYKYVYALDLYDTDLLQELEDCLNFVEEGRQQGKVLVHCQAGSSRSAAVVIAYIMRTSQLNMQEAFEFVKSRRSIVKPNEGFLRQLDLFEVMRCRVDEKHEEYRRYMLSKVAVRSKLGFSEDAVPDSVYRSESRQSSAETSYRCRKCRRTLFHSGALMVHTKGQGESAFDWRSKVPASRQQAEDGEGEDGEGEECAVSLFVEPIEWMRGQIETVEGKLACPKCKCKLGSFVWYGERCPCGAWVAPAFHVQTGKVDAMKPGIAFRPTMPNTQTFAFQATPLPTIGQSEAPPLSATPLQELEVGSGGE